MQNPNNTYWVTPSGNLLVTASDTITARNVTNGPLAPRVTFGGLQASATVPDLTVNAITLQRVTLINASTTVAGPGIPRGNIT